MCTTSPTWQESIRTLCRTFSSRAADGLVWMVRTVRERVALVRPGDALPARHTPVLIVAALAVCWVEKEKNLCILARKEETNLLFNCFSHHSFFLFCCLFEKFFGKERSFECCQSWCRGSWFLILQLDGFRCWSAMKKTFMYNSDPGGNLNRTEIRCVLEQESVGVFKMGSHAKSGSKNF